MRVNGEIFVSVASFCDPELQFTLSSLFGQASQPERLHVAVIDQSADDNRSWIAAQPFAAQIRYVQLNPVDSRGVSWARSLAFSLYQNEQWLLQIDSHTLFEPGWDERLIGQCQTLCERVARPIISTYPPPFRFDEAGKPFLPYEKSQSIYALRPKEDATMDAHSPKMPFAVTHHAIDQDFEVGHHIAGGFLFTLGRFTQDVPYDPYMYFHGEEQNMALRAYTAGYTIFHPRHALIPLAHLYKAAGQEHKGQHWRADLERQRTFSYSELMRQSDQRLARLIRGDESLGAFRPGFARPLQAFCDESGFDYANFKIQAPGPVVRPDFLTLCNTRHGPMMVANQDRSIGRSLRLCGHWAADLLDLALAEIQPGNTVIEVGSCYGEHAIPIQNKLGLNGKLVAIEPNPVLFKLLSANLVVNQYLDTLPIQAAVADQSCTVAVLTANLTVPCYLSRISLAHSKDQLAAPVKALTIDELGLNHLHVLKINTNGFDAQVLKGALETCRRLKPVVLVAGELLNLPALNQWASEAGYESTEYRLRCHSAAEMDRHPELWNPELHCLLMRPRS